MIAQLSGTLVEITPTHAIIDCGGVGYMVAISLQTFTHIQKEQKIIIFTHLIIREDNHLLYGFYTKQEREIFQKLISVSGVGPVSALMMLSTLTFEQIAQAIHGGDEKTLQSVKGIGLKTAQRIIIDLKDKIDKNTVSSVNFHYIAENNIKNEALLALEVLGIPKKNAEKIIDKLLLDNNDLTIENLIKETLKKI